MTKHALILLSFLLTAGLNARAQIVHHIPEPKPINNDPDTISLCIIGDVMMHSRQLEYDHTHFLKHIAHKLKESDFAIANMEFSLGGRPHSGYPQFSAPDSYAAYIAEDCGVDVFLIANNHILDRGKRGMRRTLHVYDSLGVKHSGAEYPLMLSRKGLKIALINFSYGSNMRDDGSEPRMRLFDKDEIRAAMDEARSQGADFILALPHWGNEYELSHSSTQEAWAEWLVENGADAIVGTHPHVVQDSTHIDGKPVIYSLGNAVSNMSARNTRLGLIATLRFVRDPLSGDSHMLEPELDFSWCTLPGMLFDNYGTILIKEWATRRNEWLTPSDYDNMAATLRRVQSATGID